MTEALTALVPNFRICGTCYRPYETFRPDGRPQRCGCHTTPERPWPGSDFNERLSLCRACGMRVLSSGSRYSQFFCEGCREVAVGVSLWAGRLIFPIGRHSFMHVWAPNAPASNLSGHHGDVDSLAHGVVRVLESIGGGAAVLEAWSRRIVAQRMVEHQLPPDVLLSVYLDAVGEAKAAFRWAAFRALCEFAHTPHAGRVQ